MFSLSLVHTIQIHFYNCSAYTCRPVFLRFYPNFQIYQLQVAGCYAQFIFNVTFGNNDVKGGMEGGGGVLASSGFRRKLSLVGFILFNGPLEILFNKLNIHFAVNSLRQNAC